MAPGSGFFTTLNQVHEIVDRHHGAPTALAEVNSLLRDSDVAREFFRNLDRPDWIGPLRDAGFFRDPPPPERSSQGTRFQDWPQSRYLTRMARHASVDVAAILSNIRTDNASIINDIIDSALAMPVDNATALIPELSEAARKGRLRIGFENASALCVRLADAGHVAFAISLATALFGPLFEKGAVEPGRRDLFLYADCLKDVVPALASKDIGFLSVLCNWLENLIDAKEHFGKESGFDHSYAWRPAIEENDQNSDHDFACLLVGFVRAAFENAIQNGMPLKDAIGIIEAHKYLVFERLRIHLINLFAEQEAGLARSTILNRALFDDYKFRHEYGMLVGDRFDLMEYAERDEFLGWIDAGPDMSDFDESVESSIGRPATDEDRRERINYWKFEKLHWVRSHLTGGRKAFYEEMLARHGEPKLAYFVIWSDSARWGWESPVGVEELSRMTFKEAVEFVSSWKPEPVDIRGPSVEGLKSTFEQLLSTRPTSFAREARILIGRPPQFVQAYISKMHSALVGGEEIDISALLELCRWIVSQPTRKTTSSATESDNSSIEDWKWTRSEVSRLLVSLCRAVSDGLHKYALKDFREPFWQLISPLCEDPVDSAIVFDADQQDPRIHDYLDMGINSPRGKAVEAVLEYARWVADHVKQTIDGKQIVPGGFDSMPEVRVALDAQIAQGNRSFEVLSIIGSRINLIHSIDQRWLAAQASALFRLDDIITGYSHAQGWAAWNAFLVWVAPHIEYYRSFKAQFTYAVTQASEVQPRERGREQPMNHLGEHLMILYGRGQLGFDDDDGLLRKFLTTANPDIRRHAIRFVGQILERDETASDEIIDRFRELWVTYWSGMGKADAKEKPNESLFGPWFTCGKFADQWALEQLEQFVEIAPTPAPDHEIADRLAKTAPTDPATAARILDHMVRGDREGWRISGWIDSAKQILESALAAGGDAKSVALGMIDFLGRRGYTGLGDLLRKS